MCGSVYKRGCLDAQPLLMNLSATCAERRPCCASSQRFCQTYSPGALLQVTFITPKQVEARSNRSATRLTEKLNGHQTLNASWINIRCSIKCASGSPVAGDALSTRPA